MFTSPKPPAPVEGLFSQRMRRFEDQRAALGGAAPRTYWQSPLAVYVCPLDALQAGSGEPAVQSTGWRYLIIEGGKFVEQAAIGHQDDGSPEWQGLMRGQARLDELAHALDGLDNAATGGTYELRLLTVPALYVTALWLKETSGNATSNDDRFIPVGNSPGLVGGTLLAAKDFWDALRRAAAALPPGESGGLAPP